MKNLRRITLAGLLALTASLTCQAATNYTEVEVTVVNQTAEKAIFGYEYFSGSVTPSPTEIDSKRSTMFFLKSVSNWASGMRFTYTVGRKKCRFEASHSAQLLLGRAIPSWKKNATSIGSGRATCTVTMTQVSTTDPFNYRVQFTIQ